MKTETIRIWDQKEYLYGAAFDFIPKITAYLHDDEKARPGILIVPGGGYRFVSPTEGNPVARRFYSKGYQAFVLTYTTNPVFAVPLKLQPLHDISRAVRRIRREAEGFRVLPDHLAVCGFSAGGHLCAALCVHYEEICDPREDYDQISNRPDAAVLSYPVITSGEKAHRESFLALLGEKASAEELAYMSLEKHVTHQTPPSFLWATVTDDVVPPDNSLMYAEALRKNNVPYALHLFSEGQHGLALADEEWAAGRGEDMYTMEQMMNVINMQEDNDMPFESEFLEAVKSGKMDCKNRILNEEAAAWPELAHIFLKKYVKRDTV